MRLRSKLFLMIPVLLGISAVGVQAQLTIDSFNRAISGMMSSNSRAAQVSNVRHVPGVTVIKLKMVVTGSGYGADEPNIPAVEISVQKNAVGIARMRSALKSNPVTNAALALKGVSISRIVAVEVFSDGALAVYIL